MLDELLEVKPGRSASQLSYDFQPLMAAGCRLRAWTSRSISATDSSAALQRWVKYADLHSVVLYLTYLGLWSVTYSSGDILPAASVDLGSGDYRRFTHDELVEFADGLVRHAAYLREFAAEVEELRRAVDVEAGQ